MPATSLNMVLFRSFASIFALLLPKLNAPLPAILIWRMKKNQNKTPISKNGATVQIMFNNIGLVSLTSSLPAGGNNSSCIFSVSLALVVKEIKTGLPFSFTMVPSFSVL